MSRKRVSGIPYPSVYQVDTKNRSYLELSGKYHPHSRAGIVLFLLFLWFASAGLYTQIEPDETPPDILIGAWLLCLAAILVPYWLGYFRKKIYLEFDHKKQCLRIQQSRRPIPYGIITAFTVEPHKKSHHQNEKIRKEYEHTECVAARGGLSGSLRTDLAAIGRGREHGQADLIRAACEECLTLSRQYNVKDNAQSPSSPKKKGPLWDI